MAKSWAASSMTGVESSPFQYLTFDLIQPVRHNIRSRRTSYAHLFGNLFHRMSVLSQSKAFSQPTPMESLALFGEDSGRGSAFSVHL